MQRSFSSVEIRKMFLDYFINNHEHKWVRSSPVIPYCDPTLAFVNAGMNQFKSIFLGRKEPQYKRVTNSQKCIRVGGKHNDLNAVGYDGYHHTYFEMLGNWSFGDYFKKEACAMALELLTGSFNISPKRLYITYFAGDETLGLPADKETYEIWRSLGFSDSRILPFGSRENFWEMGSSGPCGPCTEIHIDHTYISNSNGRAKFVNANRSDLTELWNIVFIQYNRKEDGSIVQLPIKHVDTGMGFERLVALIQNKSSNYDTDLFQPIFYAIHKLSKLAPYKGTYSSNDDNGAILDRAYRILADHARMACVCLADGMLPDQNHKLRRILRKALLLSEKTFLNENLFKNLIPIVVDTLAPAYPEIALKQSDIVEIIDHEREVYKTLRANASKAFKDILNEYPNICDIELMMECPGFVPAYREFQTIKSTFHNNKIPGDFLYKLRDTYGLTEENITKFAELENMECDWLAYRNVKANKNQQQKQKLSSELTLKSEITETLTNLTKNLKPTNNHYKYDYYYNENTKDYDIHLLKTKILAILYNNIEVNEIIVAGRVSSNDFISIITSSSNFYYESGGQESDKGWLLPNLPPTNDVIVSPKLNVTNVHSINNCIVHVCQLGNHNNNDEKFSFRCGDEILLKVDETRRSGNIRHHTAVHLLNAALRSLYKKVTYQTSSSVTSEYGKLEVGLIGRHLSKYDVSQIENFINRVIKNSVPVHIKLCEMNDVLYDSSITLIPGEIYPEYDLRLVSIEYDMADYPLISKELCCGTHVTNTKELEYFRIVDFKQINSARYAFTVVAGETAVKVQNVADLLSNQLDNLERNFISKEYASNMEAELNTIRYNVQHMKVALPYTYKMNTLERISKILKQLKNMHKADAKDFIEMEMRNVLLEKPLNQHPYVLHYINDIISTVIEDVPLQRATKLCSDRPILIICMNNNFIKARCCVPKKYRTDDFTAKKWLTQISNIFQAEIGPPRGQNPDEVCNMKIKKVSQDFKDQLDIAMQHANSYAKKFF